MKAFRFTDRWPSIAAFAEDCGMSVGRAKGIRHRERHGLGIVPDSYWRKAVAGAARRGIEGVTLATLAEAAERLAATKDAQGEVA